MPGYNHYPWCSCGWCDSQGRSWYSSEKIEQSPDRRLAKQFLQAEGVIKSFTACFVEPNATCPVCGERVFFYANEFGSRVFFDELGWPWPKHPCTDGDRIGLAPRDDVSPRPVVRTLGMREEIDNAVKRADFSPVGHFRLFHRADPPPLFKIVSVVRVGFLNLIEAKSISLDDIALLYCEFTSAKFTPEREAFFSFASGRISILDETLRSSTYQAKEITADRFQEFSAKARA